MNSYCALAFSFVAGGLLTSQPAPQPTSTATLTGHKGVISVLAFSPDGKTLASAALEAKCRACLWDTTTGKKVATLEGHGNQVLGLAFHPDGKILASGSADESVFFWDLQTQKKIATIYEPDSNLVLRVAFSTDGKTMLFGGGTIAETINIWDAAKDKLIATQAGHTKGAKAISASWDSSLFAVACGDGRIRLWDAKTGKDAGTLGKKGAEPARAVAFLPGDKELLSISDDEILQRWDIKTGKAEPIRLKHPKEPCRAAISPDATTVATGDDEGAVRVWDAKTGRLLATFEEHTKGIRVLAFNPTGTILASGSSDQLIKLWKTPQQDRK